MKKKSEKKLSLKERKERFSDRVWSTLDCCLDVLGDKLSSLKEDSSSLDLSKMSSLIGGLFDRVSELSPEEKTIKKIEDFE